MSANKKVDAPRRVVSRKQHSLSARSQSLTKEKSKQPQVQEQKDNEKPIVRARSRVQPLSQTSMSVEFINHSDDFCLGGDESLNGSLATRDMVKEFNACQFDPSCNSYDYVPSALDMQRPNMDWRRDDIEITDKMFVPTRLSQVVDNQRSIECLNKWLNLWTAKPLILPKRCVAFVRGAPGIGKTTAVRLALQEHGFNNIVEINASSERSKDMINDRLKPLIMHSSVNGGFARTAIVLEEVDGLHFGNSGGSGGKSHRARHSSSGIASIGSTSAIGGSSGNSSGADALVKFFTSAGYRPSGCDRRGLYPETAPDVCGETWQKFRSTVPIIMLANESYAPFMASLSEVSLVLKFFKLRDKQVLYRIVNQLSVALNVRWSAPSSEGYYRGVPLFQVLVSHASGDLRKATALMMEAVRACYSRRKKERNAARLEGRELSEEKNTPYLVIRKTDCQAFFGSSKEDVMDSVPTLFGSTRFVLCQMRCNCPPNTCSCCTNDPPPLGRKRVYSEEFGSSNVSDNMTTVWSQVQRMASHDIRAMPDMLFENSHLFSADPLRKDDVDSRLAASTVRRIMATYFSDAESLRSDFVYLTNHSIQEHYMQSGMVGPALLARYPHKYARLPANTVTRPSCIDRSGAGAQINLQKSSLAGEEGNAALTLSRSKQERNAYVAHFKLPYQIGLERWYRSDNFVSKIDETRSQTKMLFQDKKKSAAKTKNESDLEVIKSNQKMTKQERELLRQEIKRLEAQEKRVLQEKVAKKAETVRQGSSNNVSTTSSTVLEKRKRVERPIESNDAEDQDNSPKRPRILDPVVVVAADQNVLSSAKVENEKKKNEKDSSENEEKKNDKDSGENEEKKNDKDSSENEEKKNDDDSGESSEDPTKYPIRRKIRKKIWICDCDE